MHVLDGLAGGKAGVDHVTVVDTSEDMLKLVQVGQQTHTRTRATHTHTHTHTHTLTPHTNTYMHTHYM